MKTIIHSFLIALLMTFGSCVTSVMFPVSQIAPAADGVAKIKRDKNNNYQIDLSVKHLSNPERLTPSRLYYVVWVETDQGSTKNIGRLVSNPSNRGSLKTSTAFNPVQIFITAEEDGDVTWPGNMEIFRTPSFRVK